MKLFFFKQQPSTKQIERLLVQKFNKVVMSSRERYREGYSRVNMRGRKENKQ